MQSALPQTSKEHKRTSAAELAEEVLYLQRDTTAAAALQLRQQDEARAMATGLVMQLQVQQQGLTVHLVG